MNLSSKQEELFEEQVLDITADQSTSKEQKENYSANFLLQPSLVQPLRPCTM